MKKEKTSLVVAGRSGKSDGWGRPRKGNGGNAKVNGLKAGPTLSGKIY